jgi:hypothetical protein
VQCEHAVDVEHGDALDGKRHEQHGADRRGEPRVALDTTVGVGVRRGVGAAGLVQVGSGR